MFDSVHFHTVYFNSYNVLKVEVEVKLRPTVSRPVRLGVTSIWDQRPIFLSP
jgi:hypothetical protein